MTCSIGAFKQFNVLPLTGSNAWNLLSRAFLQLPRAESAIQHADYILNYKLPLLFISISTYTFIPLIVAGVENTRHALD